MILQSLIRFISAGAAMCAIVAPGLAEEPQLTNNTSFQIPFVVETSDGSPAAGYALLFTSVNGGPLEQSQRVAASVGFFGFTAPSDGLYAFAVRMTDESGELSGAEEALIPELEVIVDTSAPELYIQLAEISEGTVQVSWSSSDSEIAAGSLQLEYAEGADGRWIPIDTTPASSGHATVKSQPATSLSVRGYVTDLAGNRGSGTKEIILAAAANPAANTGLGTPGGGGIGSMSIPGLPSQNNNSNLPAPNSVGAIGQSPFQVPSVPAPAPNSQHQLYPTVDVSPQPPQTQLPPQPQFTYGNTAPPVIGQPATAMSPGYPASSETQANNSFSPQPYAQQNAGHSTATPPAADSSAVQVVNNRVFDIAYEVQGVGPSGVGSVELFVTENNGQQWFKYGTDEDRQSPFQVDSRGEGTFGFAVRVRNGLGFSDAPPQPGETPSIVVKVDQTPPMANLMRPQIVSENGGRIRLQWQVRDHNVDANPVRLEYAVSASGPWTPLFDWQQDQGGYEMPIQPGMPTTLYYRLLARDAAGNIATAQTPQPVLIDQQRPTARLLRVQPVSAVRRY